jgi:hypothetical protein
MRRILIKLLIVLVFWFTFLDLFVGTIKGQWRWTVGVVSVFLPAEIVSALTLRLYSRRKKTSPITEYRREHKCTTDDPEHHDQALPRH